MSSYFLETLKDGLPCGRPVPAGVFCGQHYDGYSEPRHPVPLPQLEFLLAQSEASPFSVAAIPAQKPKNKNNKKKGATGKGGQIPKWGPYGRATYAAAPPSFVGGIFEAAVPPSSNLEEAHAEIHRLHQVMAQQGNLSAAYNNFGHAHVAVQHTLPPTVPSAHFVQTFSDRPHPHYCFVHGYNVSHDGPACRVMASNPWYTAAMKAATAPVGTGGNPFVSLPPPCAYRAFTPLVPPRTVLSLLPPMTRLQAPGLPPVSLPQSEGKISPLVRESISGWATTYSVSSL
jgi:hypothetical protein